jgi:hypothetical protein
MFEALVFSALLGFSAANLDEEGRPPEAQGRAAFFECEAKARQPHRNDAFAAPADEASRVQRDRRAVNAREWACRLAKRNSTMQKNSKKPEAERNTVRKTRRCLVCGQSFPSEWAGERVCRKCKSTVAWRTG